MSLPDPQHNSKEDQVNTTNEDKRLHDLERKKLLMRKKEREMMIQIILRNLK